MTWIRTVPLSEADETLARAIVQDCERAPISESDRAMYVNRVADALGVGRA